MGELATGPWVWWPISLSTHGCSAPPQLKNCSHVLRYHQYNYTRTQMYVINYLRQIPVCTCSKCMSAYAGMPVCALVYVYNDQMIDYESLTN